MENPIQGKELCMTHEYYYRFRRTALLLFLILVGIAGCAFHRYARFENSAEVTRMFNTNSVPEYFRYYINGREDLPYAIIGIDPRYRLASPFWQPVAPNTKEFEAKVDFIWKPDTWAKYESGQGAWILSPDGEKIGIWYSMYPSTAVKVLADKQIDVDSPYNPNE